MRDVLKHDALLWLAVFRQLWLVHFDPCCFTQWFAPSPVRCRTALLFLCFLIVGIHVSGISIPLSLLMLLGWSLIWIASFASARVLIRVTINKLYFVLKKSLYVTCSSDHRSVRPNINQWKIFEQKKFPFGRQKTEHFVVLWNFMLLLLRESLPRVVTRVLTQLGTRIELSFKKDGLL